MRFAIIMGLLLVGIVSLVGLEVWHVGWAPELTRAEMLRRFWYVYLGVATIVFGTQAFVKIDKDYDRIMK